MSKRSNHYEAAFEAYLRDRRVPYVAVDEARRSLLPDDLPEDANRSLKSVDFILTAPGCLWLVDVKGRQFPSGRQRQYWKNWSTRDDVASLERWQNLFAGRFRSLLVFAYNVTDDAAPLPEDRLYIFRESRYAFLGVRVEDYAAHARLISPKWQTLSMPAGDFRRRAQPMDDLL